jgi:hypothetical protein
MPMEIPILPSALPWVCHSGTDPLVGLECVRSQLAAVIVVSAFLLLADAAAPHEFISPEALTPDPGRSYAVTGIRDHRQDHVQRWHVRL